MPETVIHPKTGISHLNSRKGIPRNINNLIRPPLKDKIQ